jgi:hypothetical protein
MHPQNACLCACFVLGEIVIAEHQALCVYGLSTGPGSTDGLGRSWPSC